MKSFIRKKTAEKEKKSPTKSPGKVTKEGENEETAQCCAKVSSIVAGCHD